MSPWLKHTVQACQIKQAPAWRAVKRLNSICDEYSRIYRTLPMMSKCFLKARWWMSRCFGSLSFRIWSVLFCFHGKEKKVLSNLKKQKNQTRRPDRSARRWISVSHETATLYPWQRTREQETNPSATHENTSSWRKGGWIEVRGVLAYLPLTDSNLGKRSPIREIQFAEKFRRPPILRG